ncbi:MAG: 5-(carboxyamino)imidazole ribonucleotide synthase [Candidatus Pelagibacter sp.]|nr:5-(carboxyamino)imidazole ribonucleotide synthase [Candidatus Pelagibacter sp.]
MNFASFEDISALNELAKRSETITVETENVPIESLFLLSKFLPVRPSAESVSICQDRIKEKNFLSSIDVPVVKYFEIKNIADFKLIKNTSYPCILKTAQFGYDGRGQIIVNSKEELAKGFDKLNNVPCVLEKKINLTKELSIIIVRNENGIVKNFPIAENKHKNGILDTSFMPAKLSDKVSKAVYSIATRIINSLNYCGVLCVEFFLEKQNLYVNELAPRPHNSGHQTIEASRCSQFEQQIRVATSMELGSTAIKYPAMVQNLMGDLWFDDKDGKSIVEPNWDLFKKPGVFVHLYGKKEPRPGRKMGHVTEIFVG